MPAEEEVDLLVYEAFFADREVGTMVDVGAARPDYLSISGSFRARGWRVISIEPNPEFTAFHRALGYEVLEYACSDEDKDDVEFHVVNSFGAEYLGGKISYESCSSLGLTEGFARQRDSRPSRTTNIRVKVRRLDTILKEHAPELSRIDLLAIDVEGWELSVLAGFNIDRYRPYVVIIENYFDDPKYRDAMSTRGYRLWKQLHPNEIYVRHGELSPLESLVRVRLAPPRKIVPGEPTPDLKIAGDRAQRQSVEVNERPLRVLLYAPWFGEYSTRLALALKDHCQVLLVLNERNSSNECALILPHEPSPRIEILYSSWDADSVGWIMEKARWFQPDLIHVQESGDDITVKAVDLLSRWRRVLLTVHDPTPHSGRDAEFMASRVSNFEALRGAATAYHVHGEHCRQLLSKALGLRKPIVSTALGLHFIPTPEMMRDPEENRLLCFGRMEAYKGIEELLDAVDNLRERNVNVHIVLAGAGSELDRLSTRITESAHHITVMNRYLAPADAVEQFQRAQAVIVPYRDATQSAVVAAAFGNGRPVIGTAVGGLVDSVRHGIDGLLVEQGDVKGLADAMEALLSTPALRSRLTEGARESASGPFSWNTIAGTLVQEYVSLLGIRV